MSNSWPVARIKDGKASDRIGHVTAPSYVAAIKKTWGLFGPDAMPLPKGETDRLTDQDRSLLALEHEIVSIEKQLKDRYRNVW